jgi:hypothetical protein
MMAYSGSWAVILDRCSDNDEVSYSVRLPEGISSMMMNYYESQELKLKSISNVRYTFSLISILPRSTLPSISTIFLLVLEPLYHLIYCHLLKPHSLIMS